MAVHLRLPRPAAPVGADAVALEDAELARDQLHGLDRELLVADADRRRELWTPRVWPGGLLVEGEVVGTWRRAEATVTLQPWRRLSRATGDAVEAEVESLPLSGIEGQIVVRWNDRRG